jgi:hypothetical protein
MILPLFGGARALWVTSLVSFQLMLLAGYPEKCLADGDSAIS